jgi:hypothetical protein
LENREKEKVDSTHEAPCGATGYGQTGGGFPGGG